MNVTENAWKVFNEAIQEYHLHDSVDWEMKNPYEQASLEHLLYAKNWIDTVQWHLEDIIRAPEINAQEALRIKRRIDASNQKRTDLVEYIDVWFLNKFQTSVVAANAELNTETPAWALDRLSILALKIYHMREEAYRESATEAHRNACLTKLQVLEEQHRDLSGAIDNLLRKIETGAVVMKTYKQMKMYNDENLNPVLYQKRNNEKTDT